jgi:hypothetical protein
MEHSLSRHTHAAPFVGQGFTSSADSLPPGRKSCIRHPLVPLAPYLENSISVTYPPHKAFKYLTIKSPLHNSEAVITGRDRGLYFKESGVAVCTIYEYRQPLPNEG